MFIREFLISDIEAVKKFTDTVIGVGYYSIDELAEYQKKSITVETKESCSFVLVDSKTQKIRGLRLALPPGNWQHGKGFSLRSDLWPNKIAKTAYFQSLFVDLELRGHGWGNQLSKRSLDIFNKLGAFGVAAHCWKESPRNSSYKYLANLGFKSVIEHSNYWINVDYFCTRDGHPCRCTAIEMYLNLVQTK